MTAEETTWGRMCHKVTSDERGRPIYWKESEPKPANAWSWTCGDKGGIMNFELGTSCKLAPAGEGHKQKKYARIIYMVLFKPKYATQRGAFKRHSKCDRRVFS